MADAKDELILAARTLIEANDSLQAWKIAPAEHAEIFADKAAPLAKILRGGRIQGLARMYEELNEKAVKARDKFKSTVVRKISKSLKNGKQNKDSRQ